MASAHQEMSVSEPALCSKCKRMVQKSGSSIHSILAYSRCRCHRFLKYRKRHFMPVTVAKEAPVPPLLSTAPQSSMILVSCSKNKLSASQLVQVAQGLDSQSKRKLVSVSTKECSVPLPVIANMLTNQKETTVQSHLKKRESTLSVTSITKLPTITGQTVKHTKQQQHTSTGGKHSHGHSRLISEVMKCVPVNKKRELKHLFKLLDKNEDGHLTLAEFLSALQKRVSMCAGAMDQLKQLYTMLSESTYFGYREFIVCYSIAEELKSIPTVEGWSVERLLSLARK